MPSLEANAASGRSRAVIPVGPQHVQAKHTRPRRNSQGHLPTTARALVLRNGKHGAMGTGELVPSNFISGSEKLYYLSEDLWTRAKAQASIMRPFSLDQAIRIADSQLSTYIDDTSALKTQEHFCKSISQQIYSCVPASQRNPSLLKDQEKVSDAIKSRIHNLHMLASAWKIIRDRLELLEREGLRDATVKSQILANEELLTEYLAVYDMTIELGAVLQMRLSLVARTSDHFSRFFKEVSGAQSPSVAFNWDHLRDVCKSFIDTIILELCLPGSEYPKYILTTMLLEALDELPKEKRRFPQTMFDAVGDLSRAVELLEILDAPLLSLHETGERFKRQPRELPDDHKAWLDAQVDSEHVLDAIVDKYLDLILPLEKAKKSSIDVLWRHIDTACQDTTGDSLWELWRLDDESRRLPYWGVSPPAIDRSKATILSSKRLRSNGRKLLADDNNSISSSGSMPSLETASESAEDNNENEDFDESEEWTDDESEDDSGDEDGEGDDYDFEAEEVLRAQLREIMDAASMHPDVFDHTKEINDGFLTDDDRKSNPFLKLLGSLRGRMFTTKSTLKTTGRKVSVPPVSVQRPVSRTDVDRQTVTAEEAKDEGEIDGSKKKKKKKKKPKKKPAVSTGVPGDAASSPLQPASPLPSDSPAPQSSLAAAITAPASSFPKKSQPAGSRTTSASTLRASLASSASESTVYLPAPQSAQSARSYLQEEGLKEKVKAKSRIPANLESVQEKQKKGGIREFLSRFTKKSKPKDEIVKEENALGEAFGGLSKKSSVRMAQILSTKDTTKHPPMKWDHFVKVMTEMGFKVDGGTAGSSVRFDPPDRDTRSISFHKPHPDAYIEPVTLRIWGKKLKEVYGWSEEIFMQYRKV